MNNNFLHHKLIMEIQMLKCVKVKKKTLINILMIKVVKDIQIKENIKIKEIINS